MADNYEDGVLEFGSHVVTVTNPDGGATFDVILDNVNPTQPVNWVERTNQLNLPAAQRGVKGFKTASAQAQLDGTNIIEPFATFTEDFGHGDEDWVVGSVSEVITKEGEKKQNIEIRKIVGS